MTDPGEQCEKVAAEIVEALPVCVGPEIVPVLLPILLRFSRERQVAATDDLAEWITHEPSCIAAVHGGNTCTCGLLKVLDRIHGHGVWLSRLRSTVAPDAD